jgi:2Fe-2S ferredoxin
VSGLPNVQVRPSGINFDAEPGETIMGAAIRSGYRWPTVCGGKAECAACAVLVEEGEQNLSPIAENEAAILHIVPILASGATVRLACQARLIGDIAVTKRGVRPTS